MPLWEYSCDEGHITTWIGRFEERPEAVKCTLCLLPKAAELIEISAFTPQEDWDPYLDENLCGLGEEGAPQIVEGRSHRKELMKKLGLEDAFRHKPGMPGQWI